MTRLILLFIAAYLAGSVNFSILVFRLLGKEDPRKHFSGNPGATNVFRQAGAGWALVVLLSDMGRAAGVALMALWLLKTDHVPWMGLALILGNRFPCFHSFRGGKGVANYLGFTAMIAPAATGISVLGWGGMFAILRLPFVSSFLMVLILSGGTLLTYEGRLIPSAGAIATAILIFYNHKSNIAEKLRRPSPPRQK